MIAVLGEGPGGNSCFLGVFSSRGAAKIAMATVDSPIQESTEHHHWLAGNKWDWYLTECELDKPLDCEGLT